MRIGIVGNGVVGGATGKAFEPVVDIVRYYDTNADRKTHALVDVLSLSDIVFVCLPTPQQNNSFACDLSYVDGFFASLQPHERNCNFVLRSTVPVGTTRLLQERYGLPNLVHSPEFLTARTAVEDAANPTRLITGIPDYMTRCTVDGTNCATLQPLLELYGKRFPGIPHYEMSSDESEAVKLFQNTFSAIKIAAFNEFRTLTDARNMDWERVLAALLAGGWINKQHTQVPGPDGMYGYGGACLPKDVANLAQCLRDAGLENWMTLAAITRNEKDRLR